MSRRTTFAFKSSRPLFTAAIGLAAVAVAPRNAGAQAAPPTAVAPPARSSASTPSIDGWDEHQPIPSGYREETRVRAELVAGGAALFGFVYVPTSILFVVLASKVKGVGPDSTDAQPDRGTPALALGAIPVAGPFVIAALGRSDSGGTTFLVVDGVVQAAGMVMLVAGLAVRRHVLARDEAFTPRGVPVPMVFGTNSAGFGFVGTF